MIFFSRSIRQMTQDDFAAIYKGLSGDMGTDVKKWTFGGLKRTGKDGTGRFSYALLLPFDFLFPLSQADSPSHLSIVTTISCEFSLKRLKKSPALSRLEVRFPSLSLSLNRFRLY